MFVTRTASFTVGTLVVTALLWAVTPSHAQEQGWPINHPTGSSSFPWNSPGYRGYDEPQDVIQRTSASTPAAQPQKYELNVNALSMMKNTADPTAVSFVAHVPENAQIWFDDEPTTSTGKLRTFFFAGLRPERKYSYVVRVAWVEDGKLVNQTHKVSFTSGDIRCVYLVQAGSKIAGEKDAVQASLSKLSADDRKLAEKQKFCAVQNGVQLGAMGAPVKILVQDQPVFLCCASCRERAESNPARTLAKVKALTAKAEAPDSK